MSAQKLRWGLLGTARINRALIPGVRASKRNELVAVGSRDLKRGKEYAFQWAIARAHGSYEDLLADPQVDVIYNSLPNHLHAEWSIKAMRAGKHVLSEKPFALSLEEVDALIAASRETGKIVAEAFMYRHHPQTLKAQELVAAGELGEVRLLRGSFSFNRGLPEDIRWVKAYGGGSLWDVGCYPVSFSRMIVGAPPVEVFGWKVMSESGVDATFAGQLRYANGIIAQFDSSFILDEYMYMEIRGSERELIIPIPFKPQQKTQITLRQGKAEKYFKFPAVNLYQGEVEDLADAVLEGRPQRVSLQESRQNIATLLALLQSAETGQPVKLG